MLWHFFSSVNELDVHIRFINPIRAQDIPCKVLLLFAVFAIGFTGRSAPRYCIISSLDNNTEWMHHFLLARATLSLLYVFSSSEDPVTSSNSILLRSSQTKLVSSSSTSIPNVRWSKLESVAWLSSALKRWHADWPVDLHWIEEEAQDDTCIGLGSSQTSIVLQKCWACLSLGPVKMYTWKTQPRC